MSGRPKALLVLSEDEQQRLESLATRPDAAPALALRARIVLACATGMDNKSVSAAQRVTPQTVSKWRARFVALRLDGLVDAPRPGAPHRIDDARIDAVLAKALTPAPGGAARWTTRSLAREMGLSQTAVSRIWRAFGLPPHLRQTPDPAGDPVFAASLRDIVGLCIDGPVRAMVLCVDAASRQRTPDPLRPPPPPPPLVAAERRASGGMRHGSTTLLAALDTAAGGFRGQARRHQSAMALLSFLRSVESGAPPQLDLHLLMGDRSAHRTALIKAWLAHHPRFHVHTLPTPTAWLQQAERCAGALIETYIGRGTYRPTQQLEQAIRQHLDSGRSARPFCWAKPAADILASIGRLHMRIDRSGRSA